MRTKTLFFLSIMSVLNASGMIDSKTQKNNSDMESNYKNVAIQDMNDIFNEEKWVADYSSWEKAFEKVMSEFPRASILTPNSNLNLFNRKMNRFFSYYDGGWSDKNFDSAIAKLEQAVLDESFDKISKCALQGKIDALEMTRTIDFSGDGDF